MMKLWEVKTGKCLHTWEFTTAIKRVQWSADGTRVRPLCACERAATPRVPSADLCSLRLQILAVTEQRMGYKGAIRVFEITREEGAKRVYRSMSQPPATPLLTTPFALQPAEPEEPVITIEPYGKKATVAAWCGLDQYIVSGHEDGRINLWDMDGELFWEPEDRAHMETITDLQVSDDSTYFVTSSKDKQAKIWSVGPDKDSNGEEQYLTLIKTFLNEPPLNSAALIPGKPYVLCGGGQEAMAVTTTSARQGHFEIRFWHRVFEEEVARVKGGFGPCNT